MSVVVEYKCPNCGAALTFDSSKQEMHCEYCGTDFDVKAVQEYNEALKQETADTYCWEEYGKDSGNGDWQSEELRNAVSFSCPSCGGTIIGDSVTAATFCPYCGNPAIMSDRLSGSFRPDLVVPFRLDKEAAKAALLKEYKGKFLLPKFFKERNNIEKITGIYVPFWLYDCSASASVRYKAARVSSWVVGNYRYTKTSFFSAIRDGSLAFENIPFDGSQKMDNSYMEAIEPFDLSAAVDFDMSYLSGYFADQYDVGAKDGIERVNERIKNSTVSLFAQSVTGYQSVLPESSSVSTGQSQIRYALLPVWLLNTDYQGKKYTFAMNGQTGKLVGEFPVSKGKFWGLFLGIFSAVTAVATTILSLIG